MIDSFEGLGPEKRLPPRLLFFLMLERISKGANMGFKGDRLPLAIAGSDEVQPISLLPAGPNTAFLRLGVRLYSKGSEYNLPGDENLEHKIGGHKASYHEDGHLYTIMAAPEFTEPFIVAQDRLESLTATSSDEEIRDYLEDLKGKGEEPHYLSDEECATLVLEISKLATST